MVMLLLQVRTEACASECSLGLPLLVCCDHILRQALLKHLKSHEQFRWLVTMTWHDLSRWQHSKQSAAQTLPSIMGSAVSNKHAAK